MTCDSCLRLTSETPIRTPANLKQVIAKVAKAVNQGVVKYEGAGQSGDPFSSLAKGGPWSDIVSNYFSCISCGQLFHLHAETYHGSGGAFEKVEKTEEQLQGDAYAA
jgi:hypothetical protein